MNLVLACRRADRIPFVPAIYEHKAALIGKTPSEVAQSEELLVYAALAEFETYRPDLLTVGMDVYNVEAEALGCKVKYYDTHDVPGIEQHLEITQVLHRPKRLDPVRSGRMGIFLRAAASLNKQLGTEVLVRGAVCGPFSLSCELVGCENMLLAMLDNNESAMAVFDLAIQTCGDYAEAFIKYGIDVVIFDSRAAPPFVSPLTWEQRLLTHYKQLTARLRRAGAHHVPLVIGGKTSSIASVLTRSGATEFLCDWGCDLNTWQEACARASAPFRANLDARLIHTGTVAEIRSQSLALVQQGESIPGFIVGTGVCAYDTPPQNILAVKEIIKAAAAGEL
jgi:uroporphyrinogen decarboxylase